MAMKEINKYSDISFEFQEIKVGRKVARIKFIITIHEASCILKDSFGNNCLNVCLPRFVVTTPV
ncbi:replication initiation protein [Clostridium estertheticum]|uniref:replication initiation protein n=1 Tax=Clostridium estertheticum TaxID=238834 RepID=UPI001C0DC756|nr:replication initiation protein [Clostridium estertheticum]MBU3201810.1 replication initiation protein [Clostridium estertheticum]